MKKIINLNDLVILLCSAIIFVKLFDPMTSCLLFVFTLVLAVLYHLCATLFGTLAKQIPTINSSYFSFENYNPKVLFARRIFEFFFACLCVWVSYLNIEFVSEYGASFVIGLVFSVTVLKLAAKARIELQRNKE